MSTYSSLTDLEAHLRELVDKRQLNRTTTKDLEGVVGKFEAIKPYIGKILLELAKRDAY